MFVNTHRCVVDTHEASYVVVATRFSGEAVPKRPGATLPRATPLGPVSVRWGQIELLGQRHWVHHCFHVQISAADLEMTPAMNP
jgi:hypothetical protein